MPEDYLQLPLERFLTDAPAAQPTPGGGSIAALAGALAISMARMAANYSIKSKKPSPDHQQLVALEEQLARTQQMLTQLTTEDMVAYETYQAAAKLPKDDPQRPAQLRSASVACVTVPSEIIAACLAGLEVMNQIKAMVKAVLLSDLGVAAELADAAAHAVAWNLRSNIATWNDIAEAEKLRRDMEAWLNKCSTLRGGIAGFLADHM